MYLMQQVFMTKLKVQIKIIKKLSLLKYFIFLASTATPEIIISSDNVDEKLDSALTDLRNKE